MKSSLHNLIPLLLLFCQLPTPETHSIQFSAATAISSHVSSQSSTLDCLLTWNFGTRLTLLNWPFLYNHFARTEQKTPFPTIPLWWVYRSVPSKRVLLLLRAYSLPWMFTESLPSNGRLLWLQYSRLRRHVTVSSLIFSSILHLGLSNGVATSAFRTRTLLIVLSHSCYISAHRILLYLAVLVVFDKECKLWSCTLRNFIQPPVNFISVRSKYCPQQPVPLNRHCVLLP
jgi:hypothetical protein